MSAATWVPLLEATGQDSISKRMMLAGQALLKVRCPGCHQPRDLYTFNPEAEAEASLGESVLAGLPSDQCLRVAKQAALFRRGAAAEGLLDALEGKEAQPRAEARKGAECTPGMPQEAKKALVDRFRDLCGLIGDAERATALQLAFYRRYPLIETACCRSKMCFKCKVRGHHPGKTCEQRQAESLPLKLSSALVVECPQSRAKAATILFVSVASAGSGRDDRRQLELCTLRLKPQVHRVVQFRHSLVGSPGSPGCDGGPAVALP